MEHLKKRDDITRLLITGKKSGNGIISIKYCKNNLGICRFLFIPQKNFGGSVRRNLIRRRLNEICRLNIEKIAVGFDIGIYVKSAVVEMTYLELESKIYSLLLKNDLIVQTGD